MTIDDNTQTPLLLLEYHQSVSGNRAKHKACLTEDESQVEAFKLGIELV